MSQLEIEFLWINILDFCYAIEELLNTEQYEDKRKWLPVFYGNRLGFLPYETEEEKEKLLKHPTFFGVFDENKKMVKLRKRNAPQYQDNYFEELTKKNNFKLEL